MWLIQVYKENKQQQRLEIKKKKMFPGLLTNSATTGLIFSPWKYDLDEEGSFICLL